MWEFNLFEFRTCPIPIETDVASHCLRISCPKPGFIWSKCHTRPFIFTIGYQHSRVARPDTILFLFLCSSSGIFPILRFKHWQVMDSFVLLVCLKTGHLMSEMSDFTQKKGGGNCMGSGVLRVARGGSGAKFPPLAVRQYTFESSMS